jgi:hypothetical protein
MWALYITDPQTTKELWSPISALTTDFYFCGLKIRNFMSQKFNQQKFVMWDASAHLVSGCLITTSPVFWTGKAPENCTTIGTWRRMELQRQKVDTPKSICLQSTSLWLSSNKPQTLLYWFCNAYIPFAGWTRMMMVGLYMSIVQRRMLQKIGVTHPCNTLTQHFVGFITYT